VPFGPVFPLFFRLAFAALGMLLAARSTGTPSEVMMLSNQLVPQACRQAFLALPQREAATPLSGAPGADAPGPTGWTWPAP